MKISTLWRVVWPERGPLFAVVGGIVSLLGDFATFIGNIASPQLLIWPIVALAGLLAWFCFGRMQSAAAAQGEVADEVLKCRECDAFRVMLFAGLGAGLLLLAGQGQTATERFGQQLGLIQQDVASIREDTSALRDVSSSVELVRNPRSAEDVFRNAWIYANVRRDGANAWASAQELYRRFTPNKLDAAELYVNAGRAFLTREQLMTQLVEVGRARRDASMLVIAGRNADSNEAALALYEEARSIDPDLPFAHWDIARVQLMTVSPRGGARAGLATAEALVAGHDRFIEVAGRKPVASYFYLPQYQPDFESMARSQRDSFTGMLENYRTAVETEDRLQQMRQR